MINKSLRWWIVGLLFLAAVLNYVDKNTLALLAPTIQKDLGLTDRDYATIQNAFQLAYTVALLASGFIVDRFGARISMALFVGWWSLANILTGFARSVSSLGMFRFLLGLGEAGNWTASPKAVADWFPAKERGLAIGIYTAGTPLGMTLAPLLIIGTAGAWGWRSTFVATGMAGLLWLVPWLFISRSRTGVAAAGPVPEQQGESEASGPEERWSWKMALRQPAVWALLLGRMFSDPVWFFYQNWFPKYLVTGLGLSQADVKLTWVMFLAAGVGSLAGGWGAGVLIKRGSSSAKARLAVMLGCAVLMPLSLLVPRVATVGVCLALVSVIAFAHLAWLTNIGALVVDLVPKASLGSVFGIIAAGSSIGAILMNDMIAYLLRPDGVTGRVAEGAYTTWYVVAAFLHLAVLPVIFKGVFHAKQERKQI